ncbi:26470_t:CDS:2, partial [Gigaspora margarita]
HPRARPPNINHKIAKDNKPNENVFDENAKKRRKRRTNISRVVSFNESSDHDFDYDNEDDDSSYVDYDNEDNVDISVISDIHSPQVAEADIEPLTLE